MNKIQQLHPFSLEDIFDLTISAVTEDLSPTFSLNQEKYERWKQFCRTLDVVGALWDKQNAQISVDEETHEIEVVLWCSQVCVLSSVPESVEVWKLSRTALIASSEDQSVTVRFKYEPLWDKT